MSMLSFNIHFHICAGFLLESGEQMRTDNRQGEETLTPKNLLKMDW